MINELEKESQLSETFVEDVFDALQYERKYTVASESLTIEPELEIEIFPVPNYDPENKRIPFAEEILPETTVLGELDTRFERVLVASSALEEMVDHLYGNRTVESAGSFFGYYLRDITSQNLYTVITHYIPFRDELTNSRIGDVQMTPGSWAQLWGDADTYYQEHKAELDKIGGDAATVNGWVHDHPTHMPPYASGSDLRIITGHMSSPHLLTVILGSGENENKIGIYRHIDGRLYPVQGLEVFGGKRKEMAEKLGIYTPDYEGGSMSTQLEEIVIEI